MNFNFRYFYLFMVYMLAGVIFIVIAGLELGYQVIWVNDTGKLSARGIAYLRGHPLIT